MTKKISDLFIKRTQNRITIIKCNQEEFNKNSIPLNQTHDLKKKINCSLKKKNDIFFQNNF